MRITLDPEHYIERIESCERNLEAVENGNYTPKEKEQLKSIYKGTLRRSKQELLSFYPEFQN